MIGRRVVIVASPALKAMKMRNAVGRKGSIVEIKPNHKGAFIKFDKPYLDEEEWYIPRESLRLLTE
jgi:hypothetical protein